MQEAKAQKAKMLVAKEQKTQVHVDKILAGIGSDRAAWASYLPGVPFCAGVRHQGKTVPIGHSDVNSLHTQQRLHRLMTMLDNGQVKGCVFKGVLQRGTAKTSQPTVLVLKARALTYTHRAQELCESRGGCHGLPVPNKPTVSVDVKQH